MYITNLESSFQKKKAHSKKGKPNPAGMAFRYRHMGYVGYVDRKFTCTDTCADTRTPHVPDNYVFLFREAYEINWIVPNATMRFLT